MDINSDKDVIVWQIGVQQDSRHFQSTTGKPVSKRLLFFSPYKPAIVELSNPLVPFVTYRYSFVKADDRQKKDRIILVRMVQAGVTPREEQHTHLDSSFVE